jgi:hypothetical protein
MRREWVVSIRRRPNRKTETLPHSKLETERPIQPSGKRVRAAPFRIPQLSRSYFWLFWKRLLTSAQFTTFHHSFR